MKDCELKKISVANAYEKSSSYPNTIKSYLITVCQKLDMSHTFERNGSLSQAQNFERMQALLHQLGDMVSSIDENMIETSRGYDSGVAGSNRSFVTGTGGVVTRSMARQYKSRQSRQPRQADTGIKKMQDIIKQIEQILSRTITEMSETPRERDGEAAVVKERLIKNAVDAATQSLLCAGIQSFEDPNEIVSRLTKAVLEACKRQQESESQQQFGHHPKQQPHVLEQLQPQQPDHEQYNHLQRLDLLEESLMNSFRAYLVALLKVLPPSLHCPANHKP
ncbi:hypothetical protein DICVIV_13674 [Dictyocaulus viviparus]|uniref:Uncharacterized protein n=1 Tax=Dictyocaulus viviparus TaxID=29172 RepID=A0A0D8X760_DICVI|nr:hypothetical protein DICVIV_13674 [Dictyocaulus viviparus]